MRYVAVPYEALELIPRKHWAAVVDLYKRAHTLRYRPFAVTERSLATAWGVSGRQVRVILAEMAAVQLLTITPGGRHVPTRISVADPVAIPVAIAEHAGPPSYWIDKDTVAVPVAVDGAVPVETLDDPDLNPDLNPDLDKQKGLGWERVCSLWEEHDPGRAARWKKSRGLGAELNKLQGRKVGDIRLVLQWLRESPDCEFHREQGFSTNPATVLRKFDVYLDKAVDWREGGARKRNVRPGDGTYTGPSPVADPSWDHEADRQAGDLF